MIDNMSSKDSLKHMADTLVISATGSDLVAWVMGAHEVSQMDPGITGCGVVPSCDSKQQVKPGGQVFMPSLQKKILFRSAHWPLTAKHTCE